MSDITVNNFKAFYEQIRPYLGAVHSGFTPIGTVISVMGTTAPLNYLACDGTVYNIADYTELAAYFNAQFGSSNFFGGNGTTTFAVPDLRGEFLRGTGTNSHADQGSGAAVGVHQDGTETPFLTIGTALSTYGTPAVKKADSTIGASVTSKVITLGNSGSNHNPPQYTSRPTNTSVLYCIASKNIFMDAGSNYSTEEQVVGTWIDGSYIWQKTINFGALPNATTKNAAHGISNLSKIISFDGYAYDPTNQSTLPLFVSYPNAEISVWCNGNNNITIATSSNRSSFTECYITLRYTKTS